MQLRPGASPAAPCPACALSPATPAPICPETSSQSERRHAASRWSWVRRSRCAGNRASQAARSPRKAAFFEFHCPSWDRDWPATPRPSLPPDGSPHQRVVARCGQALVVLCPAFTLAALGRANLNHAIVHLQVGHIDQAELLQDRLGNQNSLGIAHFAGGSAWGDVVIGVFSVFYCVFGAGCAFF